MLNKKIVFIGLILFINLSLFAQNGPKQPIDKLDYLLSMEEELNLSKRQVKQFTILKKRTNVKMQELEEQKGKTKKKEMQVLRREIRTKVDAILTDVQKNKIMEIRMAQVQQKEEEEEEKKEVDKTAERTEKGERKTYFQNAKEGLKTFKEKRIKPVLVKQKAMFESKLTKEEKDEIKELQQEIKDIKENARNRPLR